LCSWACQARGILEGQIRPVRGEISINESE
jgi:hypothetical protein